MARVRRRASTSSRSAPERARTRPPPRRSGVKRNDRRWVGLVGRLQLRRSSRRETWARPRKLLAPPRGPPRVAPTGARTADGPHDVLGRLVRSLRKHAGQHSNRLSGRVVYLGQVGQHSLAQGKRGRRQVRQECPHLLLRGSHGSFPTRAVRQRFGRARAARPGVLATHALRASPCDSINETSLSGSCLPARLAWRADWRRSEVAPSGQARRSAGSQPPTERPRERPGLRTRTGGRSAGSRPPPSTERLPTPRPLLRERRGRRPSRSNSLVRASRSSTASCWSGEVR